MSKEKPNNVDSMIQRIISSTNPYAVLGIDSQSSAATIKREYHLLIKQFHPDTWKDPRATEISKKLNDAYDQIVSTASYTAQNPAAKPERKPLLELEKILISLKVGWYASVFDLSWKLYKKIILSLDPEFKLEDCTILKDRILSVYTSNFLAGYFNIEEFVADMSSALEELRKYDAIGFVNLTERFLADPLMQEYLELYQKHKKPKTIT